MLTEENRINKNNFEKISYEITKLLIVMNFCVSYKGFHYIKDSILYLVLNKKHSINLSQDVYPYICEKYNVTMPQVEKSIRLSLTEASLNYDSKKVPNYINYFFGKVLVSPRNKTFIATACEVVNNTFSDQNYENIAY